MTQEETTCKNCQNYNKRTEIYGTCDEAYVGAVDICRMGSEEEHVNVLVGCKFGCIHWCGENKEPPGVQKC